MSNPLDDIGNFLGFGNPYNGAPAIANPNQSAYAPDLTGSNAALAQLQQFAQGPGIQLNQGASQNDSLQQQSLIDMLQGSAAGTSGPSAAQSMLGQGLESALQQGRSTAQAFSAQSANPIAALQASSGQQALLQRQNLAQMSTLRAQEQLAARQQLEQALSSKRYGDVTDTAQSLQAQSANRQMQLQSLADVLSGNLNTTQLQQYGQMAYDQARVQTQNMARQEYINSRAQDMANRRQLLSTLLQVGGTVAGAAIGGPAGAAAGGGVGKLAGAGVDAMGTPVVAGSGDSSGYMLGPPQLSTGMGGGAPQSGYSMDIMSPDDANIEKTGSGFNFHGTDAGGARRNTYV